MAFHNYLGLISMHKRAFQLWKRQVSTRDSDTTRLLSGGYSTTPVECEGVFETLTREDLERYPDGEFVHSDMKVTTSPDLMNGETLGLKDRIIYEGKTYFVHRLRFQDYRR